MKKIVLSAILMVGTAISVLAQTDARAKAILAEVSKRYRSYDAIKADFTLTIENPQLKSKRTETGTLYARSKSNKYKITTGGQELYSDGKSQWTYLKEDREVQLNNVDNSPNALNPAKIFTMYEKGFKYLYTGDVKVNGRTQNVIDLTPAAGNKSFFKVRLNIDKASRRITKALIFDKNGNRYTYLIRSFTPNVKVTDAFFTYDPKKHPGVEVVDLR